MLSSDSSPKSRTLPNNYCFYFNTSVGHCRCSLLLASGGGGTSSWFTCSFECPVRFRRYLFVILMISSSTNGILESLWRVLLLTYQVCGSWLKFRQINTINKIISMAVTFDSFLGTQVPVINVCGRKKNVENRGENRPRVVGYLSRHLFMTIT